MKTALKWSLGWLKIAVLVFFSTLLLCTPFIPLVWWLWNWIAVTKFGAPPLTLLEAAGGLFLIRFLQASVAMIGPGSKEEQKS